MFSLLNVLLKPVQRVAQQRAKLLVAFLLRLGLMALAVGFPALTLRLHSLAFRFDLLLLQPGQKALVATALDELILFGLVIIQREYGQHEQEYET